MRVCRPGRRVIATEFLWRRPACAAGGTSVGTGLNAPEGFGEAIAAGLADPTCLPLRTALNKFVAQGSLDAMCR